MNIIRKNLLFILLGIAITVSQSFAQDTTKGHSDHKHKNQNTEQEEMGNQPMKMDCMSKTDSTKEMKMMKHNMKNMERKMSSIVREGVIDLQAIDENKDGKVYQDTMDWNVISDEPGECPLCGMTLKKVSIKQAEENLIKNGFNIK